MNSKLRLRPAITGLLLTIALLFSGAISQSEAAPGQSAQRGASSSIQEVLIGFNEAPGAAQEALVRAFGGEVRQTFWLVPVIAANLPGNAIAALEATPGVSYVELNAPVYALGQTVPWGIDRVFGEETYEFSTWSDSPGAGIGVAILDTGIDGEHDDLTVVGGTNTVGGDSYADGHDHGTHVAGTVAALNNEVGVVGVAPGAALYAVKVLNDDGGGTLESVAAGIQWAVGEKIPVLNMSLGASSGSQTLQDACDAAYNAGHLLVAAAGNSGNPPGNGDNVGYPAAYSSVIAVAASRSNDGRARWSSTGPAVELIAPGESIYSTVPGGYGTMSGTSMSSPHVAGVAALIWAANLGLSNVGVRDILELSAEDLGLPSTHQGSGLARADIAVALALKDAGGGGDAETGTLTGTVTDADAEAGTVIEGARVSIDNTDLTATTDIDGIYTISDVPVGTYTVTASASGYDPETRSDVVIVENQTTTENFALVEIKTGTLSGTVTDKESAAIGGATVSIDGTNFSAETGASGEYTISDVPVGTYTVTASAKGYESATESVTIVENNSVTLDFALQPKTGSAPVIKIFDLTNKSGGPWARVEVSWSVSDEDGDLKNVTTELILGADADAETEAEDTETTSVSGTEASGTHNLRHRHEKAWYTVRITVTDEAGNVSVDNQNHEL